MTRFVQHGFFGVMSFLMMSRIGRAFVYGSGTHTPDTFPFFPFVDRLMGRRSLHSLVQPAHVLPKRALPKRGLIQ
jgi:hypothetical protein